MGSLFFYIFFLLSFFFGYGLLSFLLPNYPVIRRSVIGLFAGSFINIWVMNIFCCLFGLNIYSLLVSETLVVIATVFFWQKGHIGLIFIWNALVRHIGSISKPMLVTEISFLVFFLFVFIGIFHSVYVVNDRGLYCGITNNLGDLPLHLSYITSFAWTGNYPPDNPIYAGHPLHYPMLIDFFSAVLLHLGMPLHQTLFLPGLVFSLLFAFLLYFLTFDLTRNRWLAFGGPVLFFFSANTGFVQFFHDLTRSNSSIFDFLFNLPQNYSFGHKQNIHFYNLTVALLIPQRSFLLGFPLGVSVFLLWFEGVRTTDKRAFIASGLLTGLCPFAHMHTFMSLVFISGFLGLLSRKKQWFYFYIIGFALSVGQVLFFMSSAGRSIGIQLGWMADKDNVIWFWIKNLGLFLPLFLAGLFIWRKDKLRLHFSLSLLGLFLIANIFRLASWDFDNIKLFAWFYLGAIPMVLYALLFLSKIIRSLIPIKALGIAVSTVVLSVCMLSMTLVGITDVARAIDYETQKQFLFSREEMEAAEEVRKLTKPEAVFLAAPTYNHFLSLSGRKRILGYPDHLVSHGIDLGKLVKNVKEMFTGNNNSIRLLQQYKPDYIVIGRHEKRNQANQSFFDRYFDSIFKKGNITIYSTANLDLLDKNQPAVLANKQRLSPYDKPDNLKPGLIQSFYKSISTSEKPIRIIRTSQIDFFARASQDKPIPSPFSFLSKGWLYIEKGATYLFKLKSDDGSWLYINSRLIIDNGGEHGLIEKSQVLFLQKGYYRIKIEYFDSGGGAGLYFKIIDQNQSIPIDLTNALFSS